MSCGTDPSGHLQPNSRITPFKRGQTTQRHGQQLCPSASLPASPAPSALAKAGLQQPFLPSAAKLPPFNARPRGQIPHSSAGARNPEAGETLRTAAAKPSNEGASGQPAGAGAGLWDERSGRCPGLGSEGAGAGAGSGKVAGTGWGCDARCRGAQHPRRLLGCRCRTRPGARRTASVPTPPPPRPGSLRCRVPSPPTPPPQPGAGGGVPVSAAPVLTRRGRCRCCRTPCGCRPGSSPPPRCAAGRWAA